MKSIHLYKLVLAGAAMTLACDIAVAQTQAFSLGVAPAKATAAKAITDQDVSQLRRIGASRSEMFFNGESASNEYPFYALPSEIAGTTRLLLSLQTAISVAPENSSMRVFVNDQDVGTVTLQAGDPYRADLKIPSGVIQPGYNAVSILINQKHRVDCSVDATYELWTQIDPERSGFLLSEAGKMPGDTLSDLIALGGMSNGRTTIRGAIAPGASNIDYNRTIAAIEALSIIGSFDRPAVTIGNGPDAKAGVGVIVGTRGTVTDIVGQQVGAGLKDGVNVISSENGKGKTLVVTGQTATDVDASMEELKIDAEKHQDVGTPQGLRALANSKGRMLVSGTDVPLRNLGLISEPFNGRLYKRQLNFSMPSDFYPGDYGSLVLHLSAQYADNLAKNAELFVRANNETVAEINLSQSRSGVIDDQRLPVPLSKLRPGENTIEFEARLPVPADAVCEPVAKGGEDKSRLLLLGKSFLEVPQFARVGRYPDIAALVSGAGFDRQNGNVPVSLYVPRLGSTALDAAGSFLAKMAYSSGRILSVNVTSTVPDAHQPNVMAFGTYKDLPADIISETGLDLSTRISNLSLPGSNTDRQVASLRIDASFLGDQPSATANMTLETMPQGGLDRITAAVSKIKSGATYLTHQVGHLRDGLSTIKAEDSLYQPHPETAMLIAQKEMSPVPGVWTVVAAPSDQGLTSTVDAIMDRSIWTRLNGSIQAFSADGQVLEQIAPVRVELFQTQAMSIGNIRLIIAGWFSHHVLEYTLAEIGAGLLLGSSTFLLLKLGRRKW